MRFELTEPPLLSRSTVDRADQLRDDEERLAELWQAGRVILVDRKGDALARDGGATLASRAATDLGDKPVDGAMFLGLAGDVAHWVVTSPRDEVSTVDGEEWLGLRQTGVLLDDTQVGLVATATALANWHGRSRFCAACGTATEVGRSGWATRCPGCGIEEYPRTDPAVICLVHDGVGANGEQVLLARGPQWPENWLSVLAGFVEAGESLEACVAREIAEEVGLTVHDIRYLGSQPHPFPRSLMIGFAAHADRSAPLTLAEGEIATARWVSRAEVREALGAGEDGPLRVPGPVSIAGRMLEAWVAE
ncbi:NAD+ diphosphatase [Herbihabitans rhizosphaerae]|uniref:NAD(+) diphosphatase n=1 Tax=Herbihabitans rhizosphaerae TaxID=1872711 RepID=A0A4Q7L4N3_9PSEU|nr:NAD(+) diphosphatase [Herbihabitans rhizosphaerae]RZS44184.1 NAD+ diphosphatase [Herbihabitans rhizosphaerae]